ncbi:MAG: ribbon-helix-helix protein, CopG family [Gallionella sp.]|nr:ribbon-helix-helix protein, CopG family [Gallionella sp.]
MKTSAIEKPRSSGTVTVKLDPSDRDRIASLAAMKKRTAHYLMKEAILEYVQREEARQNFIKAADTSFEHYKETGLHITLDEFSAWVDDVQKNPDAPITACHT